MQSKWVAVIAVVMIIVAIVIIVKTVAKTAPRKGGAVEAVPGLPEGVSPEQYERAVGGAEPEPAPPAPGPGQ